MTPTTRHARLSFVFGLALCWLIPGPAQAGVLLDALADAYLDDFPRDGVVDAVEETDSLLLERGVIDATGVGFDSRPIMVFNLSPFSHLLLNQAIFSAYGSSTLGFAPPLVDPFQPDLMVYEGDGLIDASDWNRTATLAGNPTIPNTVGQFFVLERFEADVTTALQPLLTNGAAFGEFRLQSDLDGSDDVFFALLAAGTVPAAFSGRFSGPQLALSFSPTSPNPTVPEPSSGLLFGLGVLLFRRRRR